jgi:hypothetical protein
MYKRSSVILSLVLLTLISCETKERVKAPEKDRQAAVAAEQTPATGHEILVKEVIQAPSYTYLRVDENGREYWIATAKQPLEAGAVLSYGQGLEMKNFTSKELNRTFDSIWFVSQFQGAGQAAAQTGGSVSPYGQQQALQPADIQVARLTDGVTVAELFQNKAEYAGKTVRIRGQVTKFNPNIMGRNWVHLQDGTRSGERFDLTVTTSAAVHTGAVVVFEGVVQTDKDFGAGYFYDLIMEDAVLTGE